MSGLSDDELTAMRRDFNAWSSLTGTARVAAVAQFRASYCAPDLLSCWLREIGDDPRRPEGAAVVTAWRGRTAGGRGIAPLTEADLQDLAPLLVAASERAGPVLGQRWRRAQPGGDQVPYFDRQAGYCALYLAWMAAAAGELDAARAAARTALDTADNYEQAQQAAQLCHWLAAPSPAFIRYLELRRTWYWDQRASVLPALAAWCRTAPDAELRALAAWQAASLTLELGGSLSDARALWSVGAGGAGVYRGYCARALAARPAAEQQLMTVAELAVLQPIPATTRHAQDGWCLTTRPGAPPRQLTSAICLDTRGLAVTADTAVMVAPGQGLGIAWRGNADDLLPPGSYTYLASYPGGEELHRCRLSPFWEPAARP